MRPHPHPRPTRRFAVAAGAVLLTAGLAACGDDDEPTATGGDGTTTSTTAAVAPDYGGAGGDDDGATGGDGVVVAEDFSLTDLTVSPGAEFKLDNQGEQTHTLTGDEDEFDSGDVAGGAQSDPLTAPEEAGEYGFHCEIHQDMTATLTVEG